MVILHFLITQYMAVLTICREIWLPMGYIFPKSSIGILRVSSALSPDHNSRDISGHKATLTWGDVAML